MSTTSPSRTLRLVAGTVVVWLPAALLAVLRQRWHDELPTRMATHWSGTGLPDGYSGTWSSWLVCLILGIVAGLAGVAAALAHDRSPGPARAVIVACATLAGVAAVSWLICAAATLAGGLAANAELGWRVALIAACTLRCFSAWSSRSWSPAAPRPRSGCSPAASSWWSRP